MSTIESYGTSSSAPKGSRENPYTYEEYERLNSEGKWTSAYVEGMGIVLPDVYVISSFLGSGFLSDLWDWSYPQWTPWDLDEGPQGNSSNNNSQSGGNGGSGSGNSGGGGGNGNFNIQHPFHLSPYAPGGYDGALIAGIAYDNQKRSEYERRLGNRWSILSDGSYNGIPLYTERTGFKSMLFIQRDNNYKILGCVYVFAGTDNESLMESLKDWKTNLHQLLEMDVQYEYAIHNAIEISRTMGNIPLTFVGHSLGGALASIASMVTGRPAIVFNPAALSDSTISWLRKNNYSVDASNIYGYIMEGDPLTDLQSLLGMVAQGQFIRVINSSGGDAHEIDNMINNLQP